MSVGTARLAVNADHEDDNRAGLMAPVSPRMTGTVLYDGISSAQVNLHTVV